MTVENVDVAVGDVDMTVENVNVAVGNVDMTVENVDVAVGNVDVAWNGNADRKSTAEGPMLSKSVRHCLADPEVAAASVSSWSRRTSRIVSIPSSMRSSVML